MSSLERTGALYGTLEMLILKAVSLQPLHGVGISHRIDQMTTGFLCVSYGSLFPALHRMEEKGWLASEWNASQSNRRAKFYRLTKAGQRQLGIEEQAWNQLVTAIAAALRTT